ncbi:MFS transporter [Streptomyces sp. NPDC001728]|uniref:MFS transporter n=1 Tax=Streptomyces sp. NPDC001728 TaxID=3154396 RepID=UPI003319D6D9
MTTVLRRFWLLSALVGLVEFLFGATFMAVLTQRGFSGQDIGYLLALSNIAITVLELPSGAWGDRYGQRRMLVLGLTLWGAALVVYGLAPGIPLTALSLCLWGAGMAVYSGAPTSLVVNRLHASGHAESVPAAVRGAQVARWTASASGAIATVLLLKSTTPELIIGVSGVVMLLLALWTRKTWEESAKAAGGSVHRTIVDGVRRAFGARLIGLLALNALMAVLFEVLIMSWQPAAVELAGVPLGFLGMLLFGYSLAAALGSWLVKYLKSWVTGRAAAVLMALMAASMGVASLTDGVLFYLGFGLAELTCGVLFTVLDTLKQQRFPDELRNTLTSSFGAIGGLAGAGTALLFGLAWERLGLGPALGYCSLGLGLLALALLIPASTHRATARAC